MPHRPLRASLPLLALLAVACAGAQREPAADAPAPSPAAAPAGDPMAGEVPLATRADDWSAFLVHDNGDVGVWTVKAFPVFEQYACPEVIGLDDRGRAITCLSYSGTWTPVSVVQDGEWLGGLDFADVDPRIPRGELYTGGKRGHLFQVVGYQEGALDCRFVAAFPGHEIHTILAGELDPTNDTAELLVFTRPGELYEVTPTGEHGRFETRLVTELPGITRDAVALPPRGDEAPRIATVSRAGTLELLRFTPEGLHRTVLHRAPMGMGRIALAPARPNRPTLLYTTLDDGRILRHEERPDGWHTETIHRGPQGPRGLAAGRFGPTPDTETVALFGYSADITLLTRTPTGWHPETLFTDRDRGHWLSVAELDGRNATDELLASGYGARILLLTRPPGYGVEKTP